MARHPWPVLECICHLQGPSFLLGHNLHHPESLFAMRGSAGAPPQASRGRPNRNGPQQALPWDSGPFAESPSKMIKLYREKISRRNA